MSLISLDVSGPQSVEVPAARLGGAPDLVSLHAPTAALELVPSHILQETAPEPRPIRIRRLTGTTLATTAIHVGFAAAFFAFLTWRPASPVHEIETPVDVVVETPPPQPKPAPTPQAPKPEPPKPEPSKSPAQLIPQPPPAPAPDPNPPAPPIAQPPPPTGAGAPPPLLAPPPEPTRATTQTQENKPANLEPDAAALPTATHEAKPVEAPKVLSTTDTKASFAVPKPDVRKTPSPAPAPEAPKAPSETEKLAAALPMDTTALPDSFRAVLSGNGAAVNAAYKGLVYGRFRHAAEIGERARQQHLKGQVIVAFTIDDDGRIQSLAVLQSSGNPAVDALGMEMIRSAAPFPPPPPGAQRNFTPALAFGE